MELNVGHVILLNNENYIIIDKKEDDLVCLQLQNIEIKKILQFIDSEKLDFNNLKIIKNEDNIKPIANASLDLNLFILKKYKNFIIDSKTKNNPQIGSIIVKNNKYYYIFSEESQRWIVFELSKTELKNSDIFTLGNGVYYTNYFQTLINETDVFDTIYQCKEGQIELLRKRRRAYQKVVSESLPKSTESVVKLDQLSDEQYTVKTNIGDKLICISNYDKEQVDSRRHYLKKEDVVFIKIKPKRK